LESAVIFKGSILKKHSKLPVQRLEFKNERNKKVKTGQQNPGFGWDKTTTILLKMA
jgi:hypothetical protein